MPADEIRRRSRWMLRALEWNDTRARYPNIWHEGMPRQVLAFDTVVSRLRLGDLVAVYYPASQRHPERAERFLGLSRVTCLRRSHDPALDWVELETAHRFKTPLDLGEAPRRVFLCCDGGWPERGVGLFRRVFDAAAGDGWIPTEEERAEVAGHAPKVAEPPPSGGSPGGDGEPPDGAPPDAEPGESGPPTDGGDAPAEASAGEGSKPSAMAEPEPAKRSTAPGRFFGGAEYGGDMRDVRTGTWLAVLELQGERLGLVQLEPTGRSGFHATLRDAGPALRDAEAIGLAFPFGLPLPFAETLLGGPFPDEGWWALAKRLDRMSRPDYLVALQEFTEANGELKRVTVETTGEFSPLHRTEPDLGPMTYHGIRMIAEERSRFAVRPFETAQGRLLLEVSPRSLAGRLRSEEDGGHNRALSAMLQGLAQMPHWPVDIAEPFRGRCLSHRNAVDAVLAARCAAGAVLSGETERATEDLAPGHGERVRREGWIYGLDGES